jgi:nucleotide-binding universal stress UspA family protein
LKVLIATDGSAGAQRAVEAAAALSWTAGSEFRVLTVLPEPGGMPQTAAAVRARAEIMVEAARRQLQDAGRAASPAILSGVPTQVILDTARAWEADVVVMGARGLGAVRGALLGSVCAAVARAATCSVLVVKAPLNAPLRAVMAVDGSRDAEVAARRLALLGGPGNAVTVVRVVTPLRVTTLGLLPRGIARGIRAELARANEEIQNDALPQVRTVAQMFQEAGWEADTRVRSGTPFLEVIAAAGEAGAALVGAGPRGVTGIERVLLGSVSEHLLVKSGISLFIGR